jgi:hypothetical protein
MDFRIKRLNDAYNFEDLFKIYPKALMYTPGESLSNTSISAILASTSYNDQIENINGMLKDIIQEDINKMISITGFIKPDTDKTKSILNVIDYNKIELSGRTSNVGKDYLKAFYSELYRARRNDDLNFLNTVSNDIILNASALYGNVDENGIPLKSISLNDNVTAYRCIAEFLNRENTFSKATGGEAIISLLSTQQSAIANTITDYNNTVAHPSIKYIERAISGCATIKIRFLDNDTTSAVIDAMVREVNGNNLNVM